MSIQAGYSTHAMAASGPPDPSKLAEPDLPTKITSAIVPPDEEVPDDLDEDEDLLPVARRRGNRAIDTKENVDDAPADEDDLFGDEVDGEEEEP